MADLRALNAAIRAVLLNQTSAGARVSSILPERPTTPYVTYQMRGGPGAWESWSRGQTSRVLTTAWAEYEGDAMDLHTEVQAIMLPDQANPVQGLVTVLNVTIQNGDVSEQRTVHIDGVQMNAGPNVGLDPPTQLRTVECYWLVNHY